MRRSVDWKHGDLPMREMAVMLPQDLDNLAGTQPVAKKLDRKRSEVGIGESHHQNGGDIAVDIQAA